MMDFLEAGVVAFSNSNHQRGNVWLDSCTIHTHFVTIEVEKAKGGFKRKFALGGVTNSMILYLIPFWSRVDLKLSRKVRIVVPTEFITLNEMRGMVGNQETKVWAEWDAKKEKRRTRELEPGLE
ncbi:hypothetical protein QE152_g36821 [Popillia japonica]|uniref:Uncharacterized protein n=1 Tax=Popillia japonica TaxID=7064 RepID=A0AAW1ICF7_POPJA